MERLTYRDEEGHAEWRKELFEDDTGAAGELIRNTVADYEDIGLEPKEIKDIVKLFHSYRHICGETPPDRLRELVEADRDGRCVVLPKDGMLYYIEESGGEQWIGNQPIQDIVFYYGWGLALTKCSISEIGKTKHFTREAAEAVLKGDNNAET